MAFEAADAVPENAAFQKLAGAAAYDAGNFMQAVHFYAQAYFLDNSDGEAVAQMGFAYRGAGERELAERFFMRALEKKLPDEMRKDVEAELAEMGAAE